MEGRQTVLVCCQSVFWEQPVEMIRAVQSDRGAQRHVRGYWWEIERESVVPWPSRAVPEPAALPLVALPPYPPPGKHRSLMDGWCRSPPNPAEQRETHVNERLHNRWTSSDLNITQQTNSSFPKLSPRDPKRCMLSFDPNNQSVMIISWLSAA